MHNSETDIEERIFACVNKFNFKMCAYVLRDWELSNEAGAISTAESLRKQAIQGLADVYELLRNNRDGSILEQSQKEDRLVCVCFLDEQNDFQFLLEFILCQACSQ